MRISAIALLKMVMHARSGGSLEVMGFMQGKLAGETFIVTDAFRLPVEGTETRVNASDEANEYTINYLDRCRENGQMQNAVGWYHSHPGYGCWLSGIDVGTQQMQQLQGAFVAVVIDPDATISAGKVEIGAFRTYPDGYKPDASKQDFSGIIPLHKTEDYGAYADKYYTLDISIYKSTLDAQLLDVLWNKYWASTLGQNPLLTNREYSTRQMLDLSQKIRNAEKGIKGPGRRGKEGDEAMDKILKASNKIAGEEERGLLAGEIKAKLFNGFAEEGQPAMSA